MRLIIIVIAIYLLLGAVGMYFGNRKVDSATGAKRWLKYSVYILITSVLLASMVWDFFFFIALFIGLAGLYEMLGTGSTKKFPIFLFIYLVFVGGFLFFASRFEGRFQFLVYFPVFSFDAFCQITGQLIGKRPLAKRISPSKTVEGLAGGVLFCFVSVLVAGNRLPLSITQLLALGFITSVAAFSGDLLASFYKRIVHIKDYSNFLPGQGGFLDRFDSFILTAFVYSALSVFVPWINDFLK